MASSSGRQSSLKTEFFLKRVKKIQFLRPFRKSKLSGIAFIITHDTYFDEFQLLGKFHSYPSIFSQSMV